MRFQGEYNMDTLKAMAKKHKQTLLLILILLIGVCVRCIAIGDLPYGMNQDEASVAYDAFADLTYGMDRNGDHLPIYSVAWGSGQSMGYNYLMRPFIAVFGLTAVAVRLPMLLLNCLSLLAFYGFAKICFGQKTALWAAFLMAICPWHIMLSRWGLDCNLVVPMAIFMAYSFAKAPKHPAFFLLGMAFGALCLYSYAAAIIFVALFLLAVVVAALVQRSVPKRWIFSGCAVFALLSLPFAAFLVVNMFKLPATHFLGFTIPRMTTMRSDTTTVLFASTPILQDIAKNLGDLLKLLFYMDDGLISNAIPHIGAIYFILLPFIAIGLVLVVLRLKKEVRTIFLPFAWLAAAFAQAAVVFVNINHINVLFPALVLCAAVGVQWVVERIRIMRFVIAAACMIFFGVFCNYYFSKYAEDSQTTFFSGLDKSIVYATEHVPGDIYYTDYAQMSYIYGLYGLQTDPQVFIDTVEYDSLTAPFRHVRRYDRYITGITAEPEALPGQAYILHISSEVPSALDSPENERIYFDNFVLIIVHDPSFSGG